MINLKTKPEIDAEVHISEEFTELSYVDRIRLLEDWMQALQNYYDFEIATEAGFHYDIYGLSVCDMFINGKPLLPAVSPSVSEEEA